MEGLTLFGRCLTKFSPVSLSKFSLSGIDRQTEMCKKDSAHVWNSLASFSTFVSVLYLEYKQSLHLKTPIKFTLNRRAFWIKTFDF